jgi:peptide/nickel transport system permease protein
VSRAAFVARRAALAVPGALGVTVVVFFMLHLGPGDPARAVVGMRADDAAVERTRRELGLDRPLLEQYLDFMGGLLRGDLGTSFARRGQSVTEIIVDRLPVTLGMLVGGLLLSALIAVPLALIAASRQDGLRDHLVRLVPTIGLGMPSVWVGVMLVLVFSFQLGLFPIAGLTPGPIGFVHSLFLPSLTIALGAAPLLIRSLRARLLEVLDSDYVTTARAKGLPEGRVVLRHVLRNSVISAVTIFGLLAAYLIGGSLVVEKVFAVPGLGSLLVDSILARDYPVVQAVTLVVGLAVVLVNLVTDLMLSLLDPRVEVR